jgi:hypothetical protein
MDLIKDPEPATKSTNGPVVCQTQQGKNWMSDQVNARYDLTA